MVVLPVAVGDVYLVGGVARIKVTISLGGTPILGETPTITVLRDSDNFAANFTTGTFVDFGTPAGLDAAAFKFSMTELGLGTYYADFDPAAFNGTSGSYTAIVKNEGTFAVVASQEFTISDNPAFGTGTGFGVVNRCCNICLNTPVVVAYQATPGQDNVLIDIYNPFDIQLESGVVMQEFGNTGIYRHTFIGQTAGDYLMVMSEEAHGSKDSLILTVGGDADRLKRVEQLLLDLSLNPPTVEPCE